MRVMKADETLIPASSPVAEKSMSQIMGCIEASTDATLRLVNAQNSKVLMAATQRLWSREIISE